MSTFDDLLAMPEEWEKRPEAWQQLTTSDILFRALHEAVRSGAVSNWARLHEMAIRWRREHLDYLPERKRGGERMKWGTVRRLLWCTEQAATHPDFYRTEIDRVCFALANTPKFIKVNEAWAWVCIRTLLEAPSWWAEVPVALMDERQVDNEDSAFIATLVLEAIEGRAGQIVHHPIDGFYPCGDKEFLDSINDAWTAARALLQKQGVDVQRCDGRWRLRRRDGQPIQEVKGRSASGAAAWGWYFALTGKVPDDRVIVLAEIDSRGVLKEVGVDAKVKAIAADGRFDTIAVVSENFVEAGRTLKEAFKVGTATVDKKEIETGVVTAGVIRVVDIAKYGLVPGS